VTIEKRFASKKNVWAVSTAVNFLGRPPFIIKSGRSTSWNGANSEPGQALLPNPPAHLFGLPERTPIFGASFALTDPESAAPLRTFNRSNGQDMSVHQTKRAQAKYNPAAHRGHLFHRSGWNGGHHDVFLAAILASALGRRKPVEGVLLHPLKRVFLCKCRTNRMS